MTHHIPSPIHDFFLFARADTSQVVKFKEIFSNYVDCSGQIINYDKSNLYFRKGALDSLKQDVALFIRSQKEEEV